jgi:hypothetical protein
MVDICKVLPDKVVDTGIFGDGLVGAIRTLIAGN